MCYAEDRTLLFLEPVINQWPSQELIHAEWIGDELIVQTQEFKKLGLNVSDADIGPLFAINKIPKLKVVYESNEQRLYIDAPTSMLSEQLLRQFVPDDAIPVETSTGVLLNYDFYTTSSRERKAVSAWNELRWFGNAGVLSATGVYNPYNSSELYSNGAYSDYIRYDTQWVYSKPDQLFSIRAGDVITDVSSGSRALRIGGLQVARNFSLQPDFITYPLPEFTGSSTVPSSVELYVNNLRTYQSNVRPGPFTIETAPYISGAGTAQIITTDVLGRQTATTLPFYISNELLRAGLVDYSISAGVVREDYGLDSFSYGSDLVVESSVRYGWNKWLTLDAHAESTDGLQILGGGGAFSAGGYGVVNAAILSSHSEGSKNGRHYTLGYSFYSTGGGVSMQHTQRDDDYTDIGTRYSSDLLLRSDQIVGSVAINHGTLSAGYFSIELPDEAKQRYASFSYGRSLTRGASLILSYNASLDNDGESSFLLSVTLAFGERRSVNTTVTRGDDGNYSTQWAAVQTQELGGGWGWGISGGAGDNRFSEADISWRGDYIGLSGGVYRGSSDTTYWGDARGSIGIIDNRYFAANFIPDAFALVDTGEFSDVPIRFANQTMGNTDARGLRIIPWLNAYTPNYLEIDPRDLPIDTDIVLTAHYLRPAYRSGVHVHFEIEQMAAATLTLTDAKNAALPPGVDVKVRGTEIVSLTGWDGVVYFPQLPTGDIEFESETQTGRICRARANYVAQPGTIPNLGILICD